MVRLGRSRGLHRRRAATERVRAAVSSAGWDSDVFAPDVRAAGRRRVLVQWYFTLSAADRADAASRESEMLWDRVAELGCSDATYSRLPCVRQSRLRRRGSVVRNATSGRRAITAKR